MLGPMRSSGWGQAGTEIGRPWVGRSCFPESLSGGGQSGITPRQTSPNDTGAQGGCRHQCRSHPERVRVRTRRHEPRDAAECGGGRGGTHVGPGWWQWGMCRLAAPGAGPAAALASPGPQRHLADRAECALSGCDPGSALRPFPSRGHLPVAFAPAVSDSLSAHQPLCFLRVYCRPGA